MRPALFRVPKNILAQGVGDEVVILDMRTEKYFSLNRTAAFIWKCLTAPSLGQADEADYAAQFGLEVAAARSDFNATAQDFEARGFLTRA